MIVCRQCGTANETESERCRRCGTELHLPQMRGKIACQNHANREATTTCNGCGVRLCDACAYNLGGIDFCESCAPEGAVAAERDADYEQVPVVNAAQTERADFDSRFLAGVIDLGVLALCGAALWIFSGLLFRRWDFAFTARSGGIFYLFWGMMAVLAMAYHTILIALSGQTIGKQKTGVIILTPEGKALNLGQAIIRSLAAGVSLLPLGLGFLWLMWDRKHETWHDKISQTTAFRYIDVA